MGTPAGAQEADTKPDPVADTDMAGDLSDHASNIEKIEIVSGTIAVKQADNEFIQQAALLMGIANDMSTQLTIAQDLLCQDTAPTKGVSAWLQNFKLRNFNVNLKPFREKFLLSRDDNRPHFLIPSSVADVQRLNNVLDSFQQLSLEHVESVHPQAFAWGDEFKRVKVVGLTKDEFSALMWQKGHLAFGNGEAPPKDSEAAPKADGDTPTETSSEDPMPPDPISATMKLLCTPGFGTPGYQPLGAGATPAEHAIAMIKGAEEATEVITRVIGIERGHWRQQMKAKDDIEAQRQRGEITLGDKECVSDRIPDLPVPDVDVDWRTPARPSESTVTKAAREAITTALDQMSHPERPASPTPTPSIGEMNHLQRPTSPTPTTAVNSTTYHAPESQLGQPLATQPILQGLQSNIGLYQRQDPQVWSTPYQAPMYPHEYQVAPQHLQPHGFHHASPVPYVIHQSQQGHAGYGSPPPPSPSAAVQHMNQPYYVIHQTQQGHASSYGTPPPPSPHLTPVQYLSPHMHQQLQYQYAGPPTAKRPDEQRDGKDSVHKRQRTL
jgi:hypothetical protein